MTCAMHATAVAQRRWRARIFAAVWLGYGAYYLCRVNLSLAIPGIMAEFGFSKSTMGAVATSLLVAYAAGQLINGQLVDRFGGRALLALGALASAVFCFAFGFAGAAVVMTALWLANGYFQAMGWTSAVKTMANWFPPRVRGRMSGWLGTSYQVGNAYSWLLAGSLVARGEWRWAFWVPAGLLAVMGLFAYLVLRDAPEQVGLPSVEADGAAPGAPTGAEAPAYLGLGFTLRQSVANPRIWLVGCAQMAGQLARYGMLIWLPTYLFETQGRNMAAVTVRVIALPLAGCFGSVLSGWMTDRFFHSRRAPVASIELLLLAALVLGFPHLARHGLATTLALLILVGALINGSDILMAGAIAMDFASRKAAGSAAGVIDALGYVGASLTAISSGWLADHFGWSRPFALWAGGAFLAALLMATLWNYRPARGRYL